jgi:hypothetical protein
MVPIVIRYSVVNFGPIDVAFVFLYNPFEWIIYFSINQVKNSVVWS